MRTLKAIIAAQASIIALTCTAPAMAQSGPDSGISQGDIIVTARKRQESILHVPVIETVLPAQILERNQVVDLHSIIQHVPGLQIGDNVLTVGPQLALRGVGTSSLDAGVDQSVSLNIDGLQFSQGATYGIGLFDMAQIEVLKGPQSLFYGKSSTGGLIAIHTNDPGDELEVIAKGTYGMRARQKREELIISSPIGDTFGIRLAAMNSNDSGYFRNYATAIPMFGAKQPDSDRYNKTKEYILRGTAVWTPVEQFHARLKVNHSRKKVIGGGSPFGSCPDGNGAPTGIPFINPDDNCKVDRVAYIVDVDPAAFPDVRNNGTPFMKYLTTFGTLDLGYDFANDIQLSSTTGYFKTRVDGMLNGTNTGAAGPTLISDNQFHRRDFTQEIRLESDWRGPVNFLVGAYYQNADVSNRVFVGGNTAIYLPATLTGGINDVSIKTWSGFGQLRWKPVQTLEIAGGVRYSDEKRHDNASSIFSMYDNAPVPILLAKPRLHSKNWAPELTVTWTPQDNLTIFGSLKQGYKSGSFVMTIPAIPGQDNSFGDERVRGGELGIKTRLFDNALMLSTAGYFYKYDNLQVGVNEVAQGGLPVARTINAGKSEVYGLDFEATYNPPSIEGLSARLAVNWNHARFTQFDSSPCWGGQTVAEGCSLLPTEVTDPAAIADGYYVLEPGTGRRVKYNAQDLGGSHLPKAPTWQINAGVDYTMPAGDTKRLTFGINGQYSSRYLTNLGRRPDFFQRGYAKINANISIGANNDAWELALIGTNLTDKYTTGSCTQFSGATGQVLMSPISGTNSRNAAGIDELACMVDQGREIFVTLTLRPAKF